LMCALCRLAESAWPSTKYTLSISGIRDFRADTCGGVFGVSTGGADVTVSQPTSSFDGGSKFTFSSISADLSAVTRSKSRQNATDWSAFLNHIGSTVGCPISTSVNLTDFRIDNRCVENVTKLGATVWRAVDSDYFPYAWHTGGSGANKFTCERHIPSGGGNCTCKKHGSSSVVAAFVSRLPSARGTASTVEVDVYVDDSTVKADVMLLGIQFAHDMCHMIRDGRMSLKLNGDRRGVARAYSFFIYFFACIGAQGCLLAVTSLWHTWMFRSKKFSPARAAVIHWLISVAFSLIFSLAVGGFLFWILFGTFCCLFSVLANIYYCVTVRRRVTPSDVSASDVEEQAASTSKDVLASQWSQRPAPLGRRQKRLLIGLGLAVFFCLVICIGLFYGWSPENYRMWGRSSQAMTVEVSAPAAQKSVLLMYSWNHFATLSRMDFFTRLLTNWCGGNYRKPLADDEAKSAKLKKGFIDAYAINMNEYSPSDYKQYSTVNEWFIRNLTGTARPIANCRLSSRTCGGQQWLTGPRASPCYSCPSSDPVMITPADARLMVFSSLDTMGEIWIKGNAFRLSKLLDDEGAQAAGTPSLSSRFEGGAIAIVRLAPNDYHRFHAPCSGVIVHKHEATGTILSVGADAVQSRNDVLQGNDRKVSVINSPVFGDVGYVMVGATCVGSVNMNFNNGTRVEKGEELGLMQFGGSTVVLVFQRGKVKFDDDLLYNSQRGVESRVLMGQRIGEKAT